MLDIINKITSAKGHIGFYYKNMITNEVMTFNENDLFVAACEIKLPVFAALMTEMDSGRIDPDEVIRIKEEPGIPESVAPDHFTGVLEVGIKTLYDLMMTISDDIAANALIDRMGIDNCNKIFTEMGFVKTKLNRLLFDSEAAEEGIENYVCPVEFGHFLELLYKGIFINEAVSKTIKESLLRHQSRHKMPMMIGESMPVPRKMGMDHCITHNCGIVFPQKPFIAVFMSDGADIPGFEGIIREVSYYLNIEAS